jgi:hypothetical protein
MTLEQFYLTQEAQVGIRHSSHATCIRNGITEGWRQVSRIQEEKITTVLAHHGINDVSGARLL